MILIDKEIIFPIALFIVFLYILPNINALVDESNTYIQTYCPNSYLWTTIPMSIILTIYGIYIGCLDVHIYALIWNSFVFLMQFCFTMYQLSLKCSISIQNTNTYPIAVYDVIIVGLLFILNFANVIKSCCVSRSEENKPLVSNSYTYTAVNA